MFVPTLLAKCVATIGALATLLGWQVDAALAPLSPPVEK